MSTNISSSLSPHPPFQVVPANFSSSSSKSINYSSATTTFKDLVCNPDLFWDKLRDFLGYSDQIPKIPIVGGNSLDMHRLFVEVTSRGGLEKVIKYRKCKEVIETFNFKITITNAAYVLRKCYLKWLFEFEHVYYFDEPISSFWVKEEALKCLVQKYADHDKGTEELRPGLLVSGIIDGKFDDGYFVTMKMGLEELKGVLYHIPPVSIETETRRRKKKSRFSHVDENRPKSHRSGYNFFFSEHHLKLKPEYVGQERALVKEIGNMWSNLSKSDRQVYQEKGFKDVERYKREMLEYKSSIHSSAVETATATGATAIDVNIAVTDAAIAAEESQ